MSTVCAHVVQIEDTFHSFLTKEYVRPVYDGEELQFGSSSKMFPGWTLTKILDKFQYKDHVACVQVTGVDTQSKNGQVFQFSDVELSVRAYTLHGKAAVASTITFNASKDSQAKVVNIPHESLAGVWERYIVPVQYWYPLANIMLVA